MHHRLFAATALLSLSSLASAQVAGDITFSAGVTVGEERVTPQPSWSTSPPAEYCEASGAWSGRKAPSGSETLPDIMSDAAFNLECFWRDSNALVSWIAPTTNTNDTPYTDPRGFVVVYGTSPTALTQRAEVNNAAAREHLITNLAAGTWYFAVIAVNSRGIESDLSNVTSKTLSTATASRSVGISVNTKPGVATASVE